MPEIGDPLLNLLEEARRAPTSEALHRLDDTVLVEFFMEHMREWLTVPKSKGPESFIAENDIEDCAAQISRSLLIRVNAHEADV